MTWFLPGLMPLLVVTMVTLVWMAVLDQQQQKQRRTQRYLPKSVPNKSHLALPPKAQSSGIHSHTYKTSRQNLSQLTKADTGYKKPSWQSSSQPPASPVPDTFTPPLRPAASPVRQPPNHKTVIRLYALVNGDRALANRLVESVKQQSPERSNTWCYEKVIYDLERDRV